MKEKESLYIYTVAIPIKGSYETTIIDKKILALNRKMAAKEDKDKIFKRIESRGDTYLVFRIKIALTDQQYEETNTVYNTILKRTGKILSQYFDLSGQLLNIQEHLLFELERVITP